MINQTTMCRQAMEHDLNAVQRMSADAYVPAYLDAVGFVPKPAYEDYRDRIERGEVWLLECSTKPVGVIVLEKKPDHLLVYSIAVSPDEQRKGHATALLDFACRRARADGYREVRLYTNAQMEKNIALYRRCGFVEIGRRLHPTRVGDVLIDLSHLLDN